MLSEQVLSEQVLSFQVFPNFCGSYPNLVHLGNRKFFLVMAYFISCDFDKDIVETQDALKENRLIATKSLVAITFILLQ